MLIYLDLNVVDKNFNYFNKIQIQTYTNKILQAA